MIPSLMMHWLFHILDMSFPCSLLASFLLTEYFPVLLIKISSLWTKIFVEPGLFLLCSSHESRNLGLWAGSLLSVLPFFLHSLPSFCCEASHKFDSGWCHCPFSYKFGAFAPTLSIWYSMGSLQSELTVPLAEAWPVNNPSVSFSLP